MSIETKLEAAMEALGALAIEAESEASRYTFQVDGLKQLANEQHAEIELLRAAVRELEAERSLKKKTHESAFEAGLRVGGYAPDEKDARIAELEADRDSWKQTALNLEQTRVEKNAEIEALVKENKRLRSAEFFLTMAKAFDFSKTNPVGEPKPAGFWAEMFRGGEEAEEPAPEPRIPKVGDVVWLTEYKDCATVIGETRLNGFTPVKLRNENGCYINVHIRPLDDGTTWWRWPIPSELAAFEASEKAGEP